MELDAWKQFDNLRHKFTKKWEPRKDLLVEGLATQRTVRFTLIQDAPGSPFGTRWESTQRNVGTMRELAYCILAACDFVDDSNPVWAEHHSKNAINVDKFVSDD